MNRRINTRLIGGIIFSVLLIVLISAYAVRQSGAPQAVSYLPSMPAQSAVTCKTPQHSPGDSSDTVYSTGLRRSFLVHLPPSYGRQPQPLVLNYHGYSWTAQIMEHNTNMDVEADKAGFVLVFPQGVDDPPSWNAGVGTGDADDIQFTRDMLNYLESNYCVDTHHIYITGFSLGGGMAYRLACVFSDQIAAVASVSGAYYPLPEGCHPTHALPVLEIHGAADQLAPYNGNPSRDMEAVQDYLHGWLERDRCNNTVQTFFQRGDVTGTEWPHCANGVIVRHYRVSDGGHTWPGSPNTTHVIDANVVIWQFFSHFSR
jgi:polyhydroxybutyrate depolymerase